MAVQYQPIARNTLVVVVPKGNYWIGDDATMRSAPRHVRRFRSDLWLEVGYVPWTAFVEFVVSGGFAENHFWETAAGNPFPPGCIPLSVDDRCEVIREATLAGMPAPLLDAGNFEDTPVLGLTWFEASALCRFYGGRLPFEAEWEAAATSRFLPVPRTSTGPFQEWTGDTWSSRYWRADGDIRGQAWDGSGEVVLRGHGPQEPALAATARRAADPSKGLATRGFRRAWDRQPAGASAVVCSQGSALQS